MSSAAFNVERRRFLRTIAFGATALAAPGAFADRLTTPSMAEGPFYPDRLPLDTDNDLLILNDALTPAVGQITHLTGRVLDTNGDPVRNAIVEIWQVDSTGSYIHSGSMNFEQRDKNFQGFGRFLTGSTGEYYFRTIKPVSYPGRPPHIHVRINRAGRRQLTTQLFVKGDPQNDRDGLLRRIGDDDARSSLLVDFKPVAGSSIDELSANFDIVLGFTPEDS